MNIDNIDKLKSEEMKKLHAEKEAYVDHYEEEQNNFINAMTEKYNVKTLDDFRKLASLRIFPDSVSLVFAFKRFMDIKDK